MSIIRLEKLLKSGSGRNLERVVERAQNMGELTQILRDRLDTDLAQGLLAANLRDDGELALICSSSEWAARLRFEADTLLKIAAEQGLGATRCKVMVARHD